jgi:hypothetical protein
MAYSRAANSRSCQFKGARCIRCENSHLSATIGFPARAASCVSPCTAWGFVELTDSAAVAPAVVERALWSARGRWCDARRPGRFAVRLASDE